MSDFIFKNFPFRPSANQIKSLVVNCLAGPQLPNCSGCSEGHLEQKITTFSLFAPC